MSKSLKQSGKPATSFAVGMLMFCLVVGCHESSRQEQTDNGLPRDVSGPPTAEVLLTAEDQIANAETSEQRLAETDSLTLSPAQRPAEEDSTGVAASTETAGPEASPVNPSVDDSPVTIELLSPALATHADEGVAVTRPAVETEVVAMPVPATEPEADLALASEPEAVVVPAAVVTAEERVEAPIPQLNSTPQAPPLNLDSLETRLRKTKAIGVFTKLELKGQVEDLVKEVDLYHHSKSELSLGQLEEHFDLLVMKLLILVQDGDPGLSKEIASARPALWTTLADPIQFSSIKGP